VIARRLTTFAITASVALATGCGGGGNESSAESAAKTTPSASATHESGRRTVTASVDGRMLSGHCSGTEKGGTPAILLESGMGGGQEQLASIEDAFGGRTLVCSYDRAGTGQSDPPSKRPRPVSALVADLDAFAKATKAQPPYVLVGQSMGGNVVFMYAQTHPEKVAGFVSMNPGPPAETFLPAAKRLRPRPSSLASCPTSEAKTMRAPASTSRHSATHCPRRCRTWSCSTRTATATPSVATESCPR
jgi:pimeloyl-ACP methyl ester carboxylesterase